MLQVTRALVAEARRLWKKDRRMQPEVAPDEEQAFWGSALGGACMARQHGFQRGQGQGHGPRAQETAAVEWGSGV